MTVLADILTIVGVCIMIYVTVSTAWEILSRPKPNNSQDRGRVDKRE